MKNKLVIVIVVVMLVVAGIVIAQQFVSNTSLKGWLTMPTMTTTSVMQNGTTGGATTGGASTTSRSNMSQPAKTCGKDIYPSCGEGMCPTGQSCQLIVSSTAGGENYCECRYPNP